MTERRKSIRRRTLLDGRIKIEKLSGFSVDCAVRNLSLGGARLAIPAAAVVPQTFQLGISGDAPKPARLVWYKDGQAGVALGDRPAGGTSTWDGTCRRDPRQAAAAALSETSMLRARITAITARSGPDRRAVASFTRP